MLFAAEIAARKKDLAATRFERQSGILSVRQLGQVPILRQANLHRANLARGSVEVGQARPFTIRFEGRRSELTIDISLRPKSSLRRSTRAREDHLR